MFLLLAQKKGHYIRPSKPVEIIYDRQITDDGLRMDILIDNSIIIELKAQELYHPVW
jgi:GxxExxY protein